MYQRLKNSFSKSSKPDTPKADSEPLLSSNDATNDQKYGSTVKSDHNEVDSNIHHDNIETRGISGSFDISENETKNKLVEAIKKVKKDEWKFT